MQESQLLSQPNITYYYQLFTEQECDDVVNKIPNFYRSMNFNLAEKKSEVTDYRTSSSYSDNDGIFNDIRTKIFDTIKNKFDNLSIEQIENLHLLRYNSGEEYKQHTDFFNNPNITLTDNDRIATAILYLNEDFTGGETLFPELGLKIIPEKGSLLFFDYNYTYNTNKKTMHAGLPILEGTKYIATAWVRMKDYNVN